MTKFARYPVLIGLCQKLFLHLTELPVSGNNIRAAERTGGEFGGSGPEVRNQANRVTQIGAEVQFLWLPEVLYTLCTGLKQELCCWQELS